MMTSEWLDHRLCRPRARAKMYANICNLGCRQEEMEMHKLSQECHMVGIAEMWWDQSHDWSSLIAGCKFFGRDHQGR